MKRKAFQKTIVYSIFLLGIISFICVNTVLADVTYKLQVPLPDFPTNTIDLCTGNDSLSCSGIAQYIKTVYEWLIRIAVVLGVGALTVAGLLWLTARGDTKQTDTSRSIIKNTIFGVILALCSYVFLYALNPDLVSFKPLQLDKIREQNFIIECYKKDKTKPPTPSGGISTSAFSHITFSASAKERIEKPNGLAQEYVDILKEADAKGFTAHAFEIHDGTIPPSIVDFNGSETEIKQLEEFLKTKELSTDSNVGPGGKYELHAGYCK